MENANGNSIAFPSNPTADTNARESEPLLSPPSFHSDLVTKSKLLTREEECTLKTALAFVIIKARAKAGAYEMASGTSISPTNHEKNRFAKHGYTVSSTATKNGVYLFSNTSTGLHSSSLEVKKP